MGYMLDSKSGFHVGCSDKASDFAYVLAEKIVDELKKEEKERTNCYNTAGILNVAMILQDGLQNGIWSSPIEDYVREFIPRFEEWIESQESLEWDDEKNKQQHLKAYRKVLGNVQKISA